MLQLLCGGYHTKHPRTFMNASPKGQDHYLLLLVRTDSDFSVGAHHFTAPSGCSILISPNTPYRYQSISGEYMDDWISFLPPAHLTPSCQDLLFQVQQVCNQVLFLSNPDLISEYIHHILLEKDAFPQKYKEDNIHMLLTILLHHMIQTGTNPHSPQNYNPYFARLSDLRLSLQAAPYHNVSPESLAASIGISASYFQHLYMDFFHISFRSDIIRMRMEYAKELLHSTNLSIEEIADACGYSSKVHFYRQFRQIVRTTPKAYRNSHPLIRS